ncbi:hypothetical protein [Streptomyces sp. NPDC004726]
MDEGPAAGAGSYGPESQGVVEGCVGAYEVGVLAAQRRVAFDDVPGDGGGPCSFASIYRALAEHARREAYPEAVAQVHADFAALTGGEPSEPRTEAKALATR